MKSKREAFTGEKGVVMVYAALAMAMFVGFLALAVDVGYMMVTRAELQKVADAAALAGARTLGRLYKCDGDLANCPREMDYNKQQGYTADVTAIRDAVKGIALQNQAGGSTGGIIINDADIVIGNWSFATHTLTATTVSADAVRVTARRDAGANGPMTTFFARVLGVDTVNLQATATAALSGQSTAGPGGLPFPAAINVNWFNKPSEEWCNQDITFHPSSADVCAAWHAYDGADYQPTGSGERKMIEDIIAGAYQSPATYAGETQYDFTNGTLANVFTHTTIQDLFDFMKVKNDGVLDNDLDPATWTTVAAVYDSAECNPSGPITIVGFTTITITSVSGPPDSTIFATVKCDNIESGRGGGGEFGTKGDIPGLVE